MTDHAARRHLDPQDDTADNGLSDDLLGWGDRSKTETETGTTTATATAPKTDKATEAEPESSVPGPAASTWPDLDDEDYLAPPARRGRLTTGMLIALIFLAGILVGTALTKTLSPAPGPQVVYVLNDSSPSAASAAPSPR